MTSINVRRPQRCDIGQISVNDVSASSRIIHIDKLLYRPCCRWKFMQKFFWHRHLSLFTGFQLTYHMHLFHAYRSLQQSNWRRQVEYFTPTHDSILYSLFYAQIWRQMSSLVDRFCYEIDTIFIDKLAAAHLSRYTLPCTWPWLVIVCDAYQEWGATFARLTGVTSISNEALPGVTQTGCNRRTRIAERSTRYARTYTQQVLSLSECANFDTQLAIIYI